MKSECEALIAANDAGNISQQCHTCKPDSSLEAQSQSIFPKPLSVLLKSERPRQHAAETTGQNLKTFNTLSRPPSRLSCFAWLNNGCFLRWNLRLSEAAASQPSQPCQNPPLPITSITVRDAGWAYAPSASAPPTAGLTSFINDDTLPASILPSRARFSSGTKHQTPARDSDESQKSC